MSDPRSVLFRELIAEAMEDIESLREDHHLAVALEIDRVASQDPYFQSRNLCANADLFLSFAYKAM
jgi:citrate synthase